MSLSLCFLSPIQPRGVTEQLCWAPGLQPEATHHTEILYRKELHYAELDICKFYIYASLTTTSKRRTILLVSDQKAWCIVTNVGEVQEFDRMGGFFLLPPYFQNLVSAILKKFIIHVEMLVRVFKNGS